MKVYRYKRINDENRSSIFLFPERKKIQFSAVRSMHPAGAFALLQHY